MKKPTILIGVLLIFLSVETVFADGPSPRIGESVSTTGQSFFHVLYTGCGGEIAPVINADYEQAVVELVNAERWNNGNLPPLKRIDSLTNSARYHATDMGEDNYFSHDSYDRVNGNLTKVCGTWDRVLNYYGNDWRSLAENIAAGQSSPESVIADWMASTEGHKENILSTSNWEIGIGYFEGAGTYYRYWVQDFGRYANRYPIVINRETAVTTSRDVQLYIYGAGTWTEMRLRNNNGTWSAWIPFQSNVNWQLDKTIGMQSVSVELRNGGSMTTSSDEIYADLPIPQLGDLPDAIGFLYSRATGELIPPSQRLTPANLSTADMLAWQLSSQGNFFGLSTTSGNTPQSFTVTPYNPADYAPGTYNGILTVNVTNIADVIDAPCQMPVKLTVSALPLNKVFLPLVAR